MDREDRLETLEQDAEEQGGTGALRPAGSSRPRRPAVPSAPDEDALDASVGASRTGTPSDPTAEPTDERAWYVIHCYSGYENKVKHNLEQRIETMRMQDKIFQVVSRPRKRLRSRTVSGARWSAGFSQGMSWCR